MLSIEEFIARPAEWRSTTLLAAILATHREHYERNTAYRRTVAARDVGFDLRPQDLVRILRPAALTFKGYSEFIGPFPQDDPIGFLRWLQDQLSCPLPDDRWPAFRRRYGSLEALLVAVERIYADLGLEIVTSTGTSGRASIVARNGATVAAAVHAFFTGIRRIWGIERGTALAFMMPEQTRVAMARSARFGTRHLDWTADSPVYYTMPLAATPDRIRIRAGRTFRPGLEGLLERHVLHPFMVWANRRLADPRSIKATLTCLRQCAADQRPVMLLGGLAQLHTVSKTLAVTAGPLALPAGSRIATGGGIKEQYGATPAQIRRDLALAFPGAPVSDVYGMAEANWAAFECRHGHYHLPPWVYAVVTDDDDRIVEGPETEGLLAFFDPVGGGELIPPFFQTADRVVLVNGGRGYDPTLVCPCGEESPYLRDAIRRVDLVEEAGCAGQV